jgi:predicted DNA binding CopG/RHH family protein
LTHLSRTWVNPSSEGKDRGLTSNYHFTQRVDVIKSSMPRKTRIDSPDAVHHAIGRGIARQKIFLCHCDRDDFLDRLGEILTEAKTSCYARASLTKQRRINIRMTERDLKKIQAKAIEEGLPHHSLISMLIHKYNEGKISIHGGFPYNPSAHQKEIRYAQLQHATH